MDDKTTYAYPEFTTKLVEALNREVMVINEESAWEGIQSVRLTMTEDRRRIYFTTKPVEGSAVTVCVWERPSGDGSEVTVRCMDDESFTGEVVMTSSGPCFRRNDGDAVFPAWGLSEHILTPK